MKKRKSNKSKARQADKSKAQSKEQIINRHTELSNTLTESIEFKNYPLAIVKDVKFELTKPAEVAPASSDQTSEPKAEDEKTDNSKIEKREVFSVKELVEAVRDNKPVILQTAVRVPLRPCDYEDPIIIKVYPTKEDSKKDELGYDLAGRLCLYLLSWREFKQWPNHEAPDSAYGDIYQLLIEYGYPEMAFNNASLADMIRMLEKGHYRTNGHLKAELLKRGYNGPIPGRECLAHFAGRSIEEVADIIASAKSENLIGENPENPNQTDADQSGGGVRSIEVIEKKVEDSKRRVTLKMFIETFCDLSKKLVIASKVDLLHEYHRKGKIKLPKTAYKHKRGQHKYYYVDDLKRNWAKYQRNMPTLPPLKLSGTTGKLAGGSG